MSAPGRHLPLLLLPALLGGCYLSGGSELIPPDPSVIAEAPPIRVSRCDPNDCRPVFTWDGGPVFQIAITPADDFTVTMWSVSVQSGENLIEPPLTYGSVNLPPDLVSISGPFPLDPNGRYRVSYQRTVPGGVPEQEFADFVPIQGLAAGVAGGLRRPISDLARGAGHRLLLRPDGSLWAWGANGSGQLGLGDLRDRARPVSVPGLPPLRAVAAGRAHSLALARDGTVWAWGANGAGQLGLGDLRPRHLPTRVPGLAGIVAVAAQGESSEALALDGTLWRWGRLPDGAPQPRPEPVLDLEPSERTSNED